MAATEGQGALGISAGRSGAYCSPRCDLLAQDVQMFSGRPRRHLAVAPGASALNGMDINK